MILYSLLSWLCLQAGRTREDWQSALPISLWELLITHTSDLPVLFYTWLNWLLEAFGGRRD